MKISIQEEILTDGSKVCNVVLEGVVFHACSEDDAIAFITALEQIVSRFTVETLDATGPIYGW